MVWHFRRNTIIVILLIFANQAIAEDLFAENMQYVSSVKNVKDNISATSNVANTIKEEVPLSAQDQAIIDYNRGVELLKKSQEVEAIVLFKRVLNELPKYHKARMQLVQIYQKIGWVDEVEKILQTGLDLDPENLDFIKNLAMLYSQKGGHRKALSVLLTMPESSSKQVDYLALLALAYLNIDQSDMAEKYYHQLLTFNKENPVWCLGLAVAEDSSGKYKSAAEHFNQAKNLGRFNAETLDYINNKLEQIKQNY